MKWFVSFVLVAGLLAGCDPPTLDDNSYVPKTPPSNAGPPEGKPFTRRTDRTIPVPPPPIPDLNLEMLWCPPGTFTMGSPESEVGRYAYETLHKVTLTEGFWLGKHEVTQAQWQSVMGNNPSHFKGPNLPVEKVTWAKAVSFCKKLTEREKKAGRLPDGWEYTLPTEAQWEYACRSGTTTATAFGNSLSSKQANFNGTKPYGGAAVGPNLKQPTDMGSYKANPWGFFDMHGNVYEWCHDWYGIYPAGPVTDPTGPISGPSRVLRGGSWYNPGMRLRSAERNHITPGTPLNNLGFRVGFKASQ